MPFNANMTLISSTTVGAGGASSISFTSIPQTYTDLLVQWSGRTSKSATGDNTEISFNGSTANFSGKYLESNGSAAGSGSYARFVGVDSASTGTSNTFSNNMVYIPNYAGSNNKSFSADSAQENNTTQAQLTLNAGSWSQTAAITSVTLTPATGSYVQYSTAYLYGVTSTTTGAKATGGTIAYDGNYWYHIFTSSGTFTPTQSLTCDYLVIAGGGGGGRGDAGGGGAGGLRSTVGFTGGGGSLETPLSLSATGYTVTIGAGGNGASSNVGTNGSNSVFGSITSTGGGGGGGSSSSGQSGGSGGGASSSTSPGSGTTNQGYAGGSAGTYGSGGGGAGEAGSTVLNSQGGDGVSIPALAIPTNTGVNAYYAGGGGPYVGAGNGPGKGGLGGGGDGISASGITNTGGGGGGWDGTGSTGGNGGSGLVIVRYAG